MNNNPNKQKILIVEDVFFIRQRGVVVTGILVDNQTLIKIGDKFEIRRPDSTYIKTTVSGIASKCSAITPEIDLLLDGNLSKDDVPIGSELWKLTEDV